MQLSRLTCCLLLVCCNADVLIQAGPPIEAGLNYKPGVGGYLIVSGTQPRTVSLPAISVLNNA